MRTDDPEVIVERLLDVAASVQLALNKIDWSSFDRCDCKHRRFEHLAGEGTEGLQPCRIPGCGCEHWDDLYSDDERWNETAMASRLRADQRRAA